MFYKIPKNGRFWHAIAQRVFSSRHCQPKIAIAKVFDGSVEITLNADWFGSLFEFSLYRETQGSSFDEGMIPEDYYSAVKSHLVNLLVEHFGIYNKFMVDAAFVERLGKPRPDSLIRFLLSRVSPGVILGGFHWNQRDGILVINIESAPDGAIVFDLRGNGRFVAFNEVLKRQCKPLVLQFVHQIGKEVHPFAVPADKAEDAAALLQHTAVVFTE